MPTTGVKAERRAADSWMVPFARKTPALVALLAAVLPAAAAAAPAKPASSKLSPRLSEIAAPTLRSAAPGRQAAAVDLPRRGAGSLVRTGDRLSVQVRFGAGPSAHLDALRAAGARIVDVSSRYRTVTVSVDPVQLKRLASLPGVGSVTEVLAPLVAGGAPAGSPGARSAVNTCTGH